MEGKKRHNYTQRIIYVILVIGGLTVVGFLAIKALQWVIALNPN